MAVRDRCPLILCTGWVVVLRNVRVSPSSSSTVMVVWEAITLLAAPGTAPGFPRCPAPVQHQFPPGYVSGAGTLVAQKQVN
jgi:hypothetical protein